MAFDAFIKIDGIPGESTDDKHKDWIEVTAFDLCALQPSSGTVSTAGGATVGRTEHKDFMVRKLIDKASPKLFEACCAGKHLKDVTLEICRAGGDKQKYLEIKFEQILVSKYNANSFLSHEFPAEEIQFNYGKVKVTYTQQQRHSGATSGNVSAGWDLTTNKAMA